VTVRTLLALGRVSNLPTVWTNVLAGAALSGGPLQPSVLVTLGLAGSLLYVGGMFLNDAFDRGWDARERPERPIPSGRASAPAVFAAGFGLLAAGILGSALAAALVEGQRMTAGWAPAVAALGLAGLIVFYDAFHKAHPASVLVMAACRVALYGMAALTVGAFNRPVLAGAGLVGLHVVALSVIARHESGRPGLPRLVGRLIAGICLLDALMTLLAGRPGLAGLAVLGFPATLWAQRYVKGT
jgi:4-hydroxybenzoate polyprenyltransferase